jgi:hypothetical protein
MTAREYVPEAVGVLGGVALSVVLLGLVVGLVWIGGEVRVGWSEPSRARAAMAGQP